MGRRSRKRAVAGDVPSPTAETRAERDAARRARAKEARSAGAGGNASVRDRPRPGRTSSRDRPPPLWGSLPLTELVILVGIVLMVWGFLSGAGGDGNRLLVAGLAVASIAGLELAVREHVTGFRSHSTLLAGALAILVIVALGLGAGVDVLGVLLVAGLVAFGGAFYGLRELFKRRSGGLGFR